MNLAIMQARLKEVAAELEKILAQDSVSAGDLEKVKALTTESKELQSNIETLLAGEQARAAAAVSAPVTAPAARDPVAAQVETKMTATEKVDMLMKGMVYAKKEFGVASFRHVAKAFEENGVPQMAKIFEAAQQRTLVSNNASAGGILLPEDVSSDIIDILRPQTTFLQGGPTIIPMPNGTYKLPAAASGATASYRGEAKPASVSQPTFKAINMSAKLLAGIVPISNQLIRWSGPNVGQWARTDLAVAMGTAMDYAAYFGDGMDDTPLGLLNIPGIYSTAATNSTTPTYTQIDADARKLTSRLRMSNVPLIGVEWRMNYRILNYLIDLRDGNGNPIYPSLQGENPTWKGFPVRDTTQFAVNGGGATDEGQIALIAFGHTYLGDAMRMQMAVSDQATIVNGSQTINAFQDGVTVIRCEAEHDFDVRYVEAIYVLTAVRWGA